MHSLSLYAVQSVMYGGTVSNAVQSTRDFLCFILLSSLASVVGTLRYVVDIDFNTTLVLQTVL